jgi:phosphate ABC transporter permease protein PstC
LDHAYAVEILKKKNARRRNLRLASSAFAVLALTAPALPFIHLLIDEYSVRVSGYLAVFSSIRVSETALIGFPAGLRVSLILALLSVAIGMLAVLVKKPLLASGMFFASFILGIALTGFLSSLRSDLLASGSSAAAGSMQFGWMLFLLFAAAASVFSLAISGVEKSAETVFKMTAFISVGAVAVITVYMFASGLPALVKIGFGDFVFGSTWAPVAEDPSFGILNMILASLIGCAGAILIGVPIGLLTAVFLSEIAPERVARVIRPAVELLAGIPSVIYGFWGMKVLVPFIREFFTGLGYNSTGSGLTAVIVILSIMILPTIIRVAETALKSVPISYTEAALALGNTKISTIFSVQIPAARSGILAGVILGVGRAIGETMAVIMVAGNIVQFPTLFSSVRPMTAGIAFEMGYAEAGLHRQALFAIGLVLFVFIMLVNITFSYISKKGGEFR